MVLKVAVSGIPRGYQFPRSDGNWLTGYHKEKIQSLSPDIELIEMPADKVEDISAVEVLLAEGGNRVYYPGELDWEDYQKFFTCSLKWVQLCSTGFTDNITPGVLDGSVTLTNAPGLHTIPIAESVLAAMLNHAKRLDNRRIDQQNHEWNQLKCDELFKRVVLIIGLGNIGKRVAKLCKNFDMNVIGTKRSVEQVENVDLVFPSSKLKNYLPEADYIVVAAPLTSETENMLGEEEILAMKSSSYLINIGRGKIVHEISLIKALDEKRIAGAYLDCLVVEPLPMDHVFWDMNNVFIVPHDSHSSPYIGDRIMDIFCDNLRLYLDEKPLNHVCDPKRGY
jgi:phosphoglycerate dehydrogenase-like enzyme